MNPDKKKIIYITLRSDFGGGPYHIDLLLNKLSGIFDFYIAAPLNKPYGIKWIEQFDEKKFIELPFRSFSPSRFMNLVSFIRKNSIDIIHSHGKGAGIYSRLAKIFVPKVKVIHTFHGFHIQGYNSITRRIYILFERIMNRFTDRFINVSRGERQVCLGNKIFDEKKSVVIYNAIENINLTDDKLKLRMKLSLPEDRFIVISVTRFNFQKNIPLIISIAERLMKNNQFFFMIIGEGEEKNKIQKLVSLKNISNVEMLDSKENISEYLCASDVYLSTSLWEGLPYSLIEATSSGLPIVASNVTGNNEVVSDNVNGFLFNIDRSDDAVTRLLELNSSPEKIKQMSRNSLKVFDEKFQLGSMIEKMKEVYDSFAER
ncbi:MAG TPA: glycosyltransferase [Ignavibacteriaceae bacterium]